MSDLGYGFYPTHPGEVVKDELEERGISQRKFADSLGMGYSVLTVSYTHLTLPTSDLV